MPILGYLIDTNLLVLLVVGRVGREHIARHRRLRAYTAEDYDALVDLIGRIDLLLTPNTLTETSNMLSQHREPDRSRFLEMLRRLIQGSREVVVSSEVAASNTEFVRLGLTDATLIEAVTEDTPLLTVDLDLYLSAMQKSRNAPTAVNFTAFRNS